MENIEEKVKDIVRFQLGPTNAKLTRKASFVEDLGADTLDIVELIMLLEEEFAIVIPDEAAEKIETIGDAVDYIKSQL